MMGREKGVSHGRTKTRRKRRECEEDCLFISKKCDVFSSNKCKELSAFFDIRILVIT